MPSSLSNETYTPSPLPSTAGRHTSASQWSYPASLSSRNDYRQSARRPLKCRLLLEAGAARPDTSLPDASLPDATVVPGQCVNVSDSGLYAVVPLDCCVAVDQRYTFRLMIDERGPEPGEVQLVSQQGLVTRTELLAGTADEEDRVGIGVRFVGSRTGVIPMPV